MKFLISGGRSWLKTLTVLNLGVAALNYLFVMQWGSLLNQAGCLFALIGFAVGAIALYLGGD